MNTPDDDTPLESLLRARAARLTAPDPAWREAILAACETATATATPEAAATASGSSQILPKAPPVRRSWLTFPRGAAWGSLAACWLAVLFLNRETRQLNVSSSPFRPFPAGEISVPPVGGVLFLQQSDMAMLTLFQTPRRRPPTPAAAPKLPPRQSCHPPVLRNQDSVRLV